MSHATPVAIVARDSSLTCARHFCCLVGRFELVLLVVAAPFFLFPNRWTPFAAGLVVLTWLCRWAARGSLSVRTPLDLPIAVLLTMTGVAMYASVDLSASWPKFWGILLGVALYYGVANSATTEPSLCRFATLFLAIGILATLVSLPVTDWQSYQYYNLSFVTRHIPSLPSLAELLPSGGIPRWAARAGAWNRPGCCTNAVLFHPREVGGTMALLFPLALAISLFGQGRGTRGLAAVAACVFGFALILAQAMTALVGTIVAVLFLLVWRHRRLLLILPVGVTSGLLLGWRFIIALFNPANAFGWGVLERVAIWLWALQALRNEPLTGVGLNSFDYTLVGLYPMSLFYDVIHAHDVLLQVALDVGIPGLLAFLWLLIAFGWAARGALGQATTANARAVIVGIGAGVLSFLIFGTFDAITLGAKPGVALWGMLGLVSALSVGKARGERSSRPARRAIVLSATALGAILALVIALSPGVQGILFLNLGTMQAHQALAEARGGAPIPMDKLQTARQNLERAIDRGQGTAHAYGLLGSIDGWLGDCAGAVANTRANVQSGGDQPVGATWLAEARWETGDSVTAANALSGTETAATAWLRTKVGVPRTPEIQLFFYQAMLNRTISRWGPVARWWEPYLQAAIVSNEQLHHPDQAQGYLKQGGEQAKFSAPLNCYTVEASGSP